MKYIILAFSLLFLIIVGIIVLLFLKSINKNDGKVKKAAPKMVVAILVFAVIIVLFGLGIIACSLM